MFWDETFLFPDDALKLGCYIGPNIDIGPAMIAKVVKKNGQAFHRSKHRLLTPDELLDRNGWDTQDEFMARVYEKLGFQVLPRELKDIGLENTPQSCLCEDETQNEQTFHQLAEELKPTPEGGDHCIGTEMLLHRGREMARNNVVCNWQISYKSNSWYQDISSWVC